MPQPVILSVSRLREALWLAEPSPPGPGPTALAGALFHETICGLLRGPAAWYTALDGETLDDSERLRRHAYERLLGPRLTRHEEALQANGREALALWEAAGEACIWLCKLLQAARETGWIRYDWDRTHWTGAEKLVSSGEPVWREFSRPQWRAAVRIQGIPDAVLRDPYTARWCAIEFKTGDRSEAIDLCQAALYHALIGPGHAGGIALIHFTPQLRERVLDAASLHEAQERLLDLAGRLAGVVRDRVPAPLEAHRELGARIRRALDNFGLQASLDGDPVVGPTFVRYTVRPGRSTTVNRIRSRAEDLGVQLAVPTPIIQIENHALVIDVARPDREIVPFSRIRETLPAPDPLRGSLEIPLGIDCNDQVRAVDLAASENPHLLVAGTSGSGKTEWLRSAVASLLLTNTPATLRLVLIDPKRSAFRELAASPFLLHPKALVYPPDASVQDELDGLIDMMELRQREFEGAGVDDLPGWLARTSSPMPRVVCIVDEFADMMLDPRDRKLLEQRVEKLGSKARAAGIHLVLATQHPDAKTVTGRLQSNIGARICLRTTTYQQSLVALKQKGAERLLGNGDLFFARGQQLWRLQAPFLDETERKAIFQGQK